MPVSDIYDVKSGLVSVAATTATPVMELRANTSTPKRAFVRGVRVKTGTTTSTSGNILFQLARAGNTPSGGTSVTLEPQDPASGTALSGAYIGSWTTEPTQGAVLAEWELEQVSGQQWVEYPLEGCEWVLPASTASIVGFVTPSANTSTPVSFELIVSE